MKEAPKPKNETARIQLLTDLDILDTLEEQAYDDLTKLASFICDCPISLVSLVDEKRQWFKSHHGLEATETPREYAFCAHAILGDETFYVPNSEEDERFKDNPLVTGDPNVKFYAGVPLSIRDDLRVGTLCVIDKKPRDLSSSQLEALEAIARQVTAQLELRLRVKELKVVDRMKSEFVAMVSHELRTPLTSIFGSLELLNSGLLEEEEKGELINVSCENSERLIRIVNDILDLTTIESDSFSLEKSDFDIQSTLTKAQNEVESYFNKCQVNLHIDCQTSVTAHYDELRILQVLRNLLSNAAKFSPDNTTVDLIVKEDKGHILIEIRDRGRGIPEEYHEFLFDKFAKHSGKQDEKLPGTGLGLNIAKQLVVAHDGEISFDSVVGSGTTFYIKIPIK